jgi:hypothetical protein
MIMLRRTSVALQASDQMLQISGQRRATFNPLPGGWVHKSQHPGMQRLPAEPGQLVRQRRALEFFTLTAIGEVSQQRMPYSSHVDADLMRTASAGAELKQSKELKTLSHAILGDSLAPHPRVCGHLLPIYNMSADCGLDYPLCIPKIPMHDGQIQLFHLSFRKLTRQATVRRIILGHHDGPGGVLVQPMYDPGPFDAPDAGEMGTIGQERIDEGSRGITGARMHYHACSLVEHHEMGVLIDDIEGDQLRRHTRGFGRWQADGDAIALAKSIARLGRSPIHQNLLLLDELLQVGSRMRGELACQIAIKPLADILGCNRKFQHRSRLTLGKLAKEQIPTEDCHADGDRRIGDIEGGPMVMIPMDIEEIDDFIEA